MFPRYFGAALRIQISHSGLSLKGRTDKLLALEQLVEDLIDHQEGKNAIGLVFVERRITAMALHCYFSCKREDFVQRSDWLSAVEARRRLRNSELLHLEQSQDEPGGMFEDSSDDPLIQYLPSVGAKRKAEHMDTSRESRRHTAPLGDEAMMDDQPDRPRRPGKQTKLWNAFAPTVF